MACLSIRHEDGLFIICARPIFLMSDPDSDILTLELSEDASADLRSRLGKIEQYVLDGRKGPFFGQLTSIKPCESRHPGLALLRDEPTMRAVLTVHKLSAEVS
jgi:hypothetical protein